jgi:hypothetical protein
MMPTTNRVREVRARLLAAGTVVARADGRSRELSPVAIGNEERDWRCASGCARRVSFGRLKRGLEKPRTPPCR